MKERRKIVETIGSVWEWIYLCRQKRACSGGYVGQDPIKELEYLRGLKNDVDAAFTVQSAELELSLNQ